MSKKTIVIDRSTPVLGGGEGGVKAAAENMNREDWRESRVKMKNWMIEGRGRNRSGIAGRPRDSEDRDRKTNDWSMGMSGVSAIL
jgi:hypothetical protein